MKGISVWRKGEERDDSVLGNTQKKVWGSDGERSEQRKYRIGMNEVALSGI